VTSVFARNSCPSTFVPRSAPGDRLRARIVHATPSFARAELTEILIHGQARAVPPCPHFQAIEGILRAAPRTIVYVSCDVATLARDAARLTGYRANDAWPLDVMPETAHIEVVMRLARA
jgi:tRNA/tmRNA/rRNA uracil-C5-methylase (TrmA/RlmC/RlmD family)